MSVVQEQIEEFEITGEEVMSVIRGDNDASEVVNFVATRAGLNVWGSRNTDPSYLIPWEMLARLLGEAAKAGE